MNDITSGKARIIVVTLSELFWSMGLVLLPAISIYFDNWSYLYVAISSSLIVLVWLHRWIADAPRWLLQHQRVEAALRQLLESATYNNRKVPLTLDVQLTMYANDLDQKSMPSLGWRDEAQPARLHPLDLGRCYGSVQHNSADDSKPGRPASACEHSGHGIC